jgi:hypothetical protein
MMRASTAMQRHDFDPIAFVFGLLFTGSGILFMIGRFDLFNHARWLWPGLLVLLGIAVLVGARGRGSQGRERGVSGPAAEAGPMPQAPDPEAIEPPVGPEAFRLPGWPHPGAVATKAETHETAVGSSTDVLEPVEPSGPERAERDRPDPRAETEVIDKVDPEGETRVLGEPRPPEPPASG